MQEIDQVNYFGVRHLSPGAAWHVLDFLEDKKPEKVLIEGLSDANHVIPYIVDPACRPPVSILAYTKKAPVRTLVYPLAEYSPEYQALIWAHKNNAECSFIDLPSGTFLGISDLEYEGGAERNLINIYSEIAKLSGENSYDSHWERCFEHIGHKNSFKDGMDELGGLMRLLEEGDRDFHRAENLVREAFMRKKIADCIKSGIDPRKIVVIAGAYHVPSFNSSEHVMNDKEEKALPKYETAITLMPYSYHKLSRQSGYGAGNRAPYYFQFMWDLLQKGQLENLANEYLSRLVHKMAKSGQGRSSAHIIEAVRLAESLASLKGGLYPVLDDLKDAAVTVFTDGNRNALKPYMNELEVGSVVGQVPKNSLQVSIQDDFNRLMKGLKLDRFRLNEDQPLTLDLRENLNVKSEKSAHLGLFRSRFLKRLKFLQIPFARELNTENNTWTENWILNWRPESEIRLIESVLLGETIELAVSASFMQKIRECKDVKSAALLVKTACECGLTKELSLTKKLLQNLASDSQELAVLSETCLELSSLIKYGSVRKLNTEDFIPLLEELFCEAVLLLLPSANCQEEQVNTICSSIANLELVLNNSAKIIDAKLFECELKNLAQSDSINSTVSGYASALLMERALLSDSELSAEFCRRISPGIEPDLGAGWFEGLAKRNRLYLIGKKELWEQMNEYIDSLDEEPFKRALVFLRRTFADFAPSEIRGIAAIVSALFADVGESKEKLRDLVLSDSEKAALSELDDLDF